MIAPGTIWQYIGPGTGRNELHKVIFAEVEEIITFGAGHCFLGTQLDFEKCFRYVQPANQKN